MKLKLNMNGIGSYGFNSFGYSKKSNRTTSFWGTENVAVPTQSSFHPTRTSLTEATLYCGADMLASVVGIGGEVHVKYDESTTDENPIVIAWGKDSKGNPYKEKIYLKDVNSNNASPAEMIALNAHLAKTGGRTEANNAGPGALWGPLGCGCDVNTRINYTQFYEDYIAMQKLGNNKSGAALYQHELERFIFFRQQNKQMI